MTKPTEEASTNISHVNLFPPPDGMDNRTYVGLAIVALCDHATGRIREGIVSVPPKGRLVIMWENDEGEEKE